jgi:hypothetical protein
MPFLSTHVYFDEKRLSFVPECNCRVDDGAVKLVKFGVVMTGKFPDYNIFS